MRSYKLVFSMLQNVELRIPTLASHGFKKVYAKTRKGTILDDHIH
jgi:hypothetical protein